MKLLTLDIETSHAILRSFQTGGKTYIHHKQVKVPSKIITIQYKWAHEKKAKYLQWTKTSTKYDDVRNFDDSAMIEEFEKNILSKADIILVQNGDKFDSPTLNERAKALQLCILSQKPSLDILKLSRKSFRSASHKLDYRSEQLGLGGKIQMVDDDWVDIEERNVPITKKMVPYGLKDIYDTEDLGLNLEMPYYKDIPVPVEKVVLSFLDKTNKMKKENSDVFCPYCKNNIVSKEGKRGIKQRYVCKTCGKFF